MDILNKKYYKKGFDDGLQSGYKKCKEENKINLKEDIDNNLIKRFAIFDLISLLNSEDDLELLDEIESTLIKYIELK